MATKIQHRSNLSSWECEGHHRHLVAIRIQHQSNPGADSHPSPWQAGKDRSEIWEMPRGAGRWVPPPAQHPGFKLFFTLSEYSGVVRIKQNHIEPHSCWTILQKLPVSLRIKVQISHHGLHGLPYSLPPPTLALDQSPVLSVFLELGTLPITLPL